MSYSDFTPLPQPAVQLQGSPVIVSPTAPALKQRGTAWLDTSQKPSVLKIWNGMAWFQTGVNLPVGTKQGQILQTAASPFPWVADEFIDEGRF